MFRLALVLLLSFGFVSGAVAQDQNAQKGQETAEKAKEVATDKQEQRKALREKMKAEKEALQKERMEQSDKLKAKTKKKDDNGDNGDN